MKIHLNQIPVGGLHLEGEDPASILDFQDELVRVISPVSYDLEVGLSGGGLFATGTLAVDLELECVSCLERFVRRLEVRDFAVQIELEGRETVDLTEALREDILLALPPHPRCDWDESTTCENAQKFTRDLTNQPKSHKRTDKKGDLKHNGQNGDLHGLSIPPDANGKPNPWAKLDELSKKA
ncbi:MAG TPA: hypothetical protein VNQ90_13560 [Chthoniobacteraceae bacterium]|nr:hypothetical protein [Chthoniobacteraceae bacterium]